MLQNEGSLKPTRPLRDYLIPIVIVIAVAVGGYIQYTTPPEMQDPLMITIDGEEYLDSIFDETYDYTGFAHKRVEIEYPVNQNEFSKKREEIVTVFESRSIDEAWAKMEIMESPEIVKGMARWLSNGTLEEAALRYYGDVNTYRSWSPDGYVNTYVGDASESKLLCEFMIFRGDYNMYFEYYPNGGEYVMIEKGYSRYPNQGISPVWAYCVFLEEEGAPVASVLIQFMN